jgi:hypothetical protein
MYLFLSGMKSSDIFGIIVRTVGFLIVIWSFWQVVGGIDNFLENIFVPASDNDSSPTFPYFLFGVPAFILGALCFFLADWIVKLAYRE